MINNRTVAWITDVNLLNGWRPLAGFPRSMRIRCLHLMALSLDAEMTLWRRKSKRQDPKTFPSTASATLKEIDLTMYHILTSQSVSKTFSTCECERNVSALRRDWQHIYEARCHRRDWQALPCCTNWLKNPGKGTFGSWNWKQSPGKHAPGPPRSLRLRRSFCSKSVNIFSNIDPRNLAK